MSFTRLPFEQVFADESGGNIKTPQSDYLPEGRYPVVDQGKSLIGGYVNDPSRLCGGGRPAIVFGDHTRFIKYVDMPFCMGADGVKVLRPKIDADLKFLYHYLQTVKIPSAGYDRHYKYLKRTEVVVPPPPEQRRIAAILDKAEALRAKRREALAQLDELTQSIFIDMFGDPSSEAPRFENMPLESLIDDGLQNGAYFAKDAYSVDGIEMVHMSDAFGGIIQRGSLKRVLCTQSDIEKYGLTTDDIIIARRSLTYDGAAKPCMVPHDTQPLIFELSFIRIRPNKELLAPLFLFHYLNNDRVRQKFVRPFVTQSTISGINQSNLSKVPVLLPPLELQNQFKIRISFINSFRERLRESKAVLDSLFTSLQHRAFRGGL